MCEFIVVTGSYYRATHMHRICIARCLSVTSRSSIETREWIEPVFGSETTLGASYTVC